MDKGATYSNYSTITGKIIGIWSKTKQNLVEHLDIWLDTKSLFLSDVFYLETLFCQ